MLNAKNLMIGDWVEIDGKIGTVSFLDKEGYINVAINEIQMISTRNPNPIPLTPKILEKNGFEKLDFSHFQIGDRRLVLDADGRWDGPLSWHWVVTEMDTNAKGQPVVLDYYVATINYVHQLQNALRICGIEKEIML